MKLTLPLLLFGLTAILFLGCDKDDHELIKIRVHEEEFDAQGQWTFDSTIFAYPGTYGTSASVEEGQLRLYSTTGCSHLWAQSPLTLPDFSLESDDELFLSIEFDQFAPAAPPGCTILVQLPDFSLNIRLEEFLYDSSKSKLLFIITTDGVEYIGNFACRYSISENSEDSLIRFFAQSMDIGSDCVGGIIMNVESVKMDLVKRL